jgi:hypothetical protein
MHKLCSNCSQMAAYSFMSVVSTIGFSPRLQKCTLVVLFCDDCLRELCECLCTEDLRKAVNNAYTALNQRLASRSKAK